MYDKFICIHLTSGVLGVEAGRGREDDEDVVGRKGTAKGQEVGQSGHNQL